MSEVLNNRETKTVERSERQEKLKQIIKELHSGRTVEEVRSQFEEAVGEISVREISQMEQSLMEEENIPVEDVQRLCSVHTEVFKGAIEDIHGTKDAFSEVNHPLETFRRENQEIEQFVQVHVSLHLDRFAKNPSVESAETLLADLKKLLSLDAHYSRKENLLFPYLETYGIYGPTQVMWGGDDQIRTDIKDALALIKGQDWEVNDVFERVSHVIKEVTEMVFKEENILFPMAYEHLTEDEWLKVEREGDVIGYAFIESPSRWQPERADLSGGEEFFQDGTIQLETGILRVDQLELMMSHLPVDITYIDENDIVRFFSLGKEPIFQRTKSVIGRAVQHCHPPKSAHLVEELLDELKSGRKDTEDFWIPFQEKYIHIRYFAVRDHAGVYKGTLEMKQNIQPIQEITGEKRLMSQ